MHDAVRQNCGAGGRSLEKARNTQFDLVHDLVYLRLMATQVNVHEAKTQFSRLLRRVAAGEEIIIARGGEPIARLVAMKSPSKQPQVGLDVGQVHIAEDFDALPDELLREFEA
jgi:prevent-host-death family protein